MVEDQQLREIRRQAGLKGGNPILVKQKDNQHGYPAWTPLPSPTPSPSPKKDRKDVYIKLKNGQGGVKRVSLRDLEKEVE